jgi:hypothetical protein
VVASDLKIGGFIGAKTGENITKKIAMLQEESITFDKSGRVNADCLHILS